jgi:hypothetical protein
LTTRTRERTFRRSSFCADGTCVEVSPLDNGAIALRDAKDLSAPEHVFTRAEWIAFVRGVKAGEFDFDLPMSEAPSVDIGT